MPARPASGFSNQASVDDREKWDRLLADAADERASQPQRICQLCVDMLHVSGAGISVLTSAGLIGLVSAADGESVGIEELQRHLRDGPGIDALLSASPVLAADLAQPGNLSVDRWPVFMRGALLAGVRAVFVFPLRLGAVDVGVLSLYRTAVGALLPAELAAALLAADAAALSLLHLDESPVRFSKTPDIAWLHQAPVHQAAGMIQIQLGISTEQAFLVLRARAFAEDRPIVDVAAEVVARTLRFTTEDT